MTLPPAQQFAAARPSKPWLLMFVAVCLVAVNMRAPITGVGPLLEDIAASFGTTPAALGALASVPLIMWGFVSPFVHGMGERFGLERTVSWSIAILALGTVWRSLPGGSLTLWLGTACIGAALAVGNVLMPALIRRDFASRIPLVMGMYSAILGGVGAIASGVVVPLSSWAPGGSALEWRGALLLTGTMVPVALLVWLFATRRGARALKAATAANDPAPTRSVPLQKGTAGRRIWRDPVAWGVAVYMGLQSFTFYVMLTWVAPIQTSFGRSTVDAGFDVMLFQLAGITGSVCLPLFYRGRLRRWLPALIAALTSTSFVCFLVLPGTGTPWLITGGFGVGISLSISLMLMAIRAREQAGASALSGMAQSVGYLIAATGPALFGYLHEWSGSWSAPLVLMLVVAVVHLGAGILVGRERFVFETKRDLAA